MARPSKDPQIRLNEIMDAAEPLFYEKGYVETTIDDISRKAGIAHGGIYYYFRSKEEILEALISRCLSRIVAKFQVMDMSKINSPAQKLSIVLREIINVIYCDKGLLFEFLYNESNIHFLDKLSRKGKQAVNIWIVEIISEGVKKGVFNVLDINVAAKIINSLIDSIIEEIYMKTPSDIIKKHFFLVERCMECVLGAEVSSICLNERS